MTAPAPIPDLKTVTKPILSETKGWFEKAVPAPNTKNFTTQLGVHVEEFGEMLVELTPENEDMGNAIQDAVITVKHLAERLKRKGGVFVKEEQHVAFLDSLTDQMVTATGVAHMANFEPLGALNEVNRANFSKFDDQGNPIFDENMKVTKGPNYVPPDLTPFV